MEIEMRILENLDKYINSFLHPQILFQLENDPEVAVAKYIEEHKKLETFPVMVNRLREERNLNPKELYTKAWIDRKLYSQIMGLRHYQPAKNTALAFGLALELTCKEMELLLKSAGFSINFNAEFDLVIAFCMENHFYDIAKVNDLLVSRNQPVLR
jgi:hypothetical protein